jgi:hypothetical protein
MLKVIHISVIKLLLVVICNQLMVSPVIAQDGNREILEEANEVQGTVDTLENCPLFTDQSTYNDYESFEKSMEKKTAECLSGGEGGKGGGSTIFTPDMLAGMALGVLSVVESATMAATYKRTNTCMNSPAAQVMGGVSIASFVADIAGFVMFITNFIKKRKRLKELKENGGNLDQVEYLKHMDDNLKFMEKYLTTSIVSSSISMAGTAIGVSIALTELLAVGGAPFFCPQSTADVPNDLDDPNYQQQNLEPTIENEFYHKLMNLLLPSALAQSISQFSSVRLVDHASYNNGTHKINDMNGVFKKGFKYDGEINKSTASDGTITIDIKGKHGETGYIERQYSKIYQGREIRQFYFYKTEDGIEKEVRGWTYYFDGQKYLKRVRNTDLDEQEMYSFLRNGTKPARQVASSTRSRNEGASNVPGSLPMSQAQINANRATYLSGSENIGADIQRARLNRINKVVDELGEEKKKLTSEIDDLEQRKKNGESINEDDLQKKKDRLKKVEADIEENEKRKGQIVKTTTESEDADGSKKVVKADSEGPDDDQNKKVTQTGDVDGGETKPKGIFASAVERVRNILGSSNSINEGIKKYNQQERDELEARIQRRKQNTTSHIKEMRSNFERDMKKNNIRGNDLIVRRKLFESRMQTLRELNEADANLARRKLEKQLKADNKKQRAGQKVERKNQIKVDSKYSKEAAKLVRNSNAEIREVERQAKRDIRKLNQAARKGPKHLSKALLEIHRAFEGNTDDRKLRVDYKKVSSKGLARDKTIFIDEINRRKDEKIKEINNNLNDNLKQRKNQATGTVATEQEGKDKRATSEADKRTTKQRKGRALGKVVSKARKVASEVTKDTVSKMKADVKRGKSILRKNSINSVINNKVNEARKVATQNIKQSYERSRTQGSRKSNRAERRAVPVGAPTTPDDVNTRALVLPAPAANGEGIKLGKVEQMVAAWDKRDMDSARKLADQGADNTEGSGKSNRAERRAVPVGVPTTPDDVKSAEQRKAAHRQAIAARNEAERRAVPVGAPTTPDDVKSAEQRKAAHRQAIAARNEAERRAVPVGAPTTPDDVKSAEQRKAEHKQGIAARGQTSDLVEDSGSGKRAPATTTPSDSASAKKAEGFKNAMGKVYKGIGIGGSMMALTTLILTFVDDKNTEKFLVGLLLWGMGLIPLLAVNFAFTGSIGAFMSQSGTRVVLGGIILGLTATIIAFMSKGMKAIKKQRKKLRELITKLEGSGSKAMLKNQTSALFNSVEEEYYKIEESMLNFSKFAPIAEAVAAKVPVTPDNFKYCLSKRGKVDKNCACAKRKQCFKVPRKGIPKALRKSKHIKKYYSLVDRLNHGKISIAEISPKESRKMMIGVFNQMARYKKALYKKGKIKTKDRKKIEKMTKALGRNLFRKIGKNDAIRMTMMNKMQNPNLLMGDIEELNIDGVLTQMASNMSPSVMKDLRGQGQVPASSMSLIEDLMEASGADAESFLGISSGQTGVSGKESRAPQTEYEIDHIHKKSGPSIFKIISTRYLRKQNDLMVPRKRRKSSKRK